MTKRMLRDSHTVFRNLKLIATFVALTALAITATSPVHADEGRIQITFFKAGRGSGSGYLFFQGFRKLQRGLRYESSGAPQWIFRER
jgi:hypothetical protein